MSGPVTVELADARAVAQRFSLGHTLLARLVNNGEIRSKKLGARQQARRLYRLADVRAYLEGDGK